MKNFKQFLAEELERGHRIDHFIEFAAHYLEIPVPEVTFLHERDEHMTTASYNVKTKEIRVYVKDRAMFDICRSIAHEMVHAMQHMREHPDALDGSTGSPHEDEANAVAGRIIRSYGQKHPEFYEQE